MGPSIDGSSGAGCQAWADGLPVRDETVPFLLVGLVAGVCVDRLPKRRILIGGRSWTRANTCRLGYVSKAMLRVIRRPAFALLWIGGLVSLTGDWLLITGLPLVVFQLTGSTLALGATVLASGLPRMVVSSFAGVFVDRWDRRHTMLVCDVLLALGLVPLLLVDSADRLWIVVGVVLFESGRGSVLSAGRSRVPALCSACP